MQLRARLPVFELAIFRDASFAKPWLYVAAMLAIGAVYLVFLLISRGGPKALKMLGLVSIDAILDADNREKIQR